MLTPSIGFCCTPLTIVGCGRPADLEDRRRDVDDVVELVADLALALMPRGQWTIVPLRVPPQCEATCLVHW